MRNLMIKVENETGLVRDPVSGAVLNTNVSGYKQYVETRERNEKAKQTLEQNTQDIAELKKDFGDIKNMLSQILDNLKK